MSLRPTMVLAIITGRTWKALRLKRWRAVGVGSRRAKELARRKALELKALKEIAEIRQAQAELEKRNLDLRLRLAEMNADCSSVAQHNH